MDSDSSDISMDLDQSLLSPSEESRPPRTTRANKLTAEEKLRVSQLLAPQNQDIHKRIRNIDLYRDNLARLRSNRMLDDEVMNAYFDVLTNPRDADPDAAAAVALNDGASPLPLNALAFNSYFYKTLVTGGYSKVAKWTKGLNMFDPASYDYLIVPIHIECSEHWCLLAINLLWRRIDYFDSLYSPEHRIDLELIKDYLCREHNSRRGEGAQFKEMKPHHWKTNETRLTGPQQNNLSDCGVFVCQIARALLYKKPVRGVKASDMVYWRGKMLLELMDY